MQTYLLGILSGSVRVSSRFLRLGRVCRMSRARRSRSDINYSIEKYEHQHESRKPLTYHLNVLVQQEDAIFESKSSCTAGEQRVSGETSGSRDGIIDRRGRAHAVDRVGERNQEIERELIHNLGHMA